MGHNVEKQRYYDAVKVVPEDAFWVAVESKHWHTVLEEPIDWNSAFDVYSKLENSEEIPVGCIKMGLLDDVYKKGYTIRPLGVFMSLTGPSSVVLQKGRKS